MGFPLPVIRDAYRVFDQRAAEVAELSREQGSPVPCKRGCSACCSEPLLVSQFCMPPIIEAIRALPADAQELIRLRTAEWVRVIRQKGMHPDQTDDELDFALWHQAPKPVCPLLDVGTGDCMVYDARPMGCRAHVSAEADAEPCKRADASKGIKVLVFTDEVARVMSHVMSHSVRGKNRDIALLMLLLPSMLARAWTLVEHPTIGYFEWFEEIDRRVKAGERI